MMGPDIVKPAQEITFHTKVHITVADFLLPPVQKDHNNDHRTTATSITAPIVSVTPATLPTFRPPFFSLWLLQFRSSRGGDGLLFPGHVCK